MPYDILVIYTLLFPVICIGLLSISRRYTHEYVLLQVLPWVYITVSVPLYGIGDGGVFFYLVMMYYGVTSGNLILISLKYLYIFCRKSKSAEIKQIGKIQLFIRKIIAFLYGGLFIYALYAFEGHQLFGNRYPHIIHIALFLIASALFGGGLYIKRRYTERMHRLPYFIYGGAVAVVILITASLATPFIVINEVRNIAGSHPYCLTVYEKPVERFADMSGITMRAGGGRRIHTSAVNLAVLAVSAGNGKVNLYHWSYNKIGFDKGMFLLELGDVIEEAPDNTKLAGCVPEIEYIENHIRL